MSLEYKIKLSRGWKSKAKPEVASKPTSMITKEQTSFHFFVDGQKQQHNSNKFSGQK